jgi:CheY-like chemotaxis protein
MEATGGPRVLVVEDDSITALALCMTLESMGFVECDRTRSGEEAVEKVQRFLPDLVLMDIRLSGDMDGIETVEHIRAIVDVPVIYITGFADETTLRRAEATRPSGVVRKPYEEENLRTTIQNAVSFPNPPAKE